VLRCLALILLGGGLAACAGWLSGETGSTVLRLGQQVIVASTLAVGLGLSDNGAKIAANLKECLAAAGILIGLLVLCVYLGLIGVIESPTVLAAAQALLLSVGWYPRGPDAWFPLSVVVWVFSTGVVLFCGVIGARFVRARLRH
jgi:hypothetical protein